MSKTRTRRDFTPGRYEELLKALIRNRYRSWSPAGQLSSSVPGEKGRKVILRHDVDKKSRATLWMAELESRLGLHSIYYFRRPDGGFDEPGIRQVVSLGHDIGYHYEALSKSRGDLLKAMELFKAELAELRRTAQVTTACMHGSPLSRWDNRRLWDSNDYRTLGIVFEPYFDLDFDQVLYLTDTGRRWDGGRANVRDKVRTRFRQELRTTTDVIAALDGGVLPDLMMINCHPHRWDGRVVPWLKELLWQNFKNVAKTAVVRWRR